MARFGNYSYTKIDFINQVGVVLAMKRRWEQSYRWSCIRNAHLLGFAIGCSSSEEYLFYAQEASSFSRLISPLSRFSPTRSRQSSSFCSYSHRGEAAPRASRCFICLSALFITCNLALARARVISYWFSAPFPSVPWAVASSSPPFCLLFFLFIFFFFSVSSSGERAWLRSYSIVMWVRNIIRRREEMAIDWMWNIVICITMIVKSRMSVFDRRILQKMWLDLISIKYK